jgi:hypothetical protein
MRKLLWRSLTALLLAAATTANAATPVTRDSQVDVELVIAVDISFSMDSDEQELQRDG